MIYNFETIAKRTGTGSYKWDQMKAWNPMVSEDIVPFSVADMDLRNAPEITEGLIRYISDNVLGYTGPTPSYYESVCGWMQKRHGWAAREEWIVVHPGVVSAFFTAVRALTDPGNGVIVMTPVYYPFMSAIERNGRQIVRNPLRNVDGHYEIDFDDLEQKAKDPNNKALLFCSPHNPVGRVWTPEELRKIGEICLRNDVLILSDEIHHDLILPGHKHTVFAALSRELADRMVVFTAPSKTFNLAGLSTSNILIPNPDLRQKYQNTAMELAIRGANALGLKACEIAYTKCGDWLDQLIVLIDHNHKTLKDFLQKHLPQIKAYDLEGTYLQWMDFNALGLSNEQLEERMHKGAQLFFDEGYIFGEEGSGFERMNIACPTSVMVEGLERLRSTL